MLRDHIVLPKAEKDFLEAFRWYVRRSPQAARRFVREFDVVITKIATRPESFSRFDAVHRYAKVKRYPYIVLFRESVRIIWVVGIGHVRRSQRFWKLRTA